MEKINSEHLHEIMTILMEKDKELTYSVIATEVSISKRDVTKAKRGGDLHIRYYIAIIVFIFESIRLGIDIHVLVKTLRKVVDGEEDLLIATMPRKRGKASAPEQWTVLMKWDRN